ncbi:hypothetical protein HWV62_189 [Athelia sp. TMB]|nr:hypothetical protein HWV62_189 [Athelia sp. TMB]
MHEGPIIKLPLHQIEQLDGISASIPGCMQLLRRCPYLIRCADFTVTLYGRQPELNDSDRVTHHLRSLDLSLYLDTEPPEDEEDQNVQRGFEDFFERTELPFLSNLRLNLIWEAVESRPLTSFLSASPQLQRLVLGVGVMSQEDFYSIIKAVPNLVELNCYNRSIMFGNLYTQFLSSELGGQLLLPNLRKLTLHGQLIIDPMAFTAMVRSRTRTCTHRGEMLQLRVYILKGSSLSVGDLAEVKSILGDRADIQGVENVQGSSWPDFPDFMPISYD